MSIRKITILSALSLILAGSMAYAIKSPQNLGKPLETAKPPKPPKPPKAIQLFNGKDI